MDEEQSNVLKKIKEVILSIARKHGIEVDRVILFGSRARGDYREESDLDVLVVTREKLDKNKKYEFIHEARRKIVWEIDRPVDIIVVSRKYHEDFKNVYGSIPGMATLEGYVI